MLIPLLVVVGLCDVGQAGLILTGVSNTQQETETVGPLRWGGNVWNPPKPGMNIIRCGQFGNRVYLGTRLLLNASQPLQVFGKILEPTSKDVTLNFHMLYGTNPNFRLGGVALQDPWSLEVLSPPMRWSAVLFFPQPAYETRITIQVSMNDTNGTYYQCIDLAFADGAVPLPADVKMEPTLAGIVNSPPDSPSSGPEDPTNGEMNSPGEKAEFTSVNIVVVMCIVLLAICLALVLHNYKASSLDNVEALQPEVEHVERLRTSDHASDNNPPEDEQLATQSTFYHFRYMDYA